LDSRYRGIFTPLVTPIELDERPDLRSLAKLVEYQISNGVHGLWAMGTSSEFASFDEHERSAVIETVVESVAGRLPVIANVSDASTRGAIRHALCAQSAGADAIAATPPYYYPHTQDELLAHYRTIRDAVDLPLFIYNIPQTVRVRVEQTTARTLADDGCVSGIKDSQNDLEWFRQLVLFVRTRNLPFRLFAGTRFLIDIALQVGADGAIPSIANAFPRLCVEVYEAVTTGDSDRASSIEARIMEIEALTGQVSGGSRNAAILGLIKTVLASNGIIESPSLTSPLRNLTQDERNRMLEALGMPAGTVEQRRQPGTVDAALP
jgi:4-hydroxy-tetrahydrodipicolinate synthase